jgi:hypothetical protein
MKSPRDALEAGPTCTCISVARLHGNEAEAYARTHLTKVSVDAMKFTKTYLCPRTGLKWLVSFPQSHLQANGPPILVKISND